MSPAVFRPLRHRNFALVWSSALISNIGSWMQVVALGVFVTASTHDALWTGLVAAAAFLPNGLLAPVGGALADRFDRRRWLLWTTVGEALGAAALAWAAAAGVLSPALAVGLAFASGSVSALGFPAYQAMLPALVEGEDVFAAVTLSSAQYNLGRVIGPVLAAATLALGSYATAFALNAASFGAVVVALLMVRLPVRASAPGGRLFAEIRRGVRIALGEPGCRAAISLIGLTALLAAPFIGLIPAMAIEGLGLHGRAAQSAGTSTLVVAQGLGAVLSLLAVPTIANRVGRTMVLRAAMVITGPLLVLYGLSPRLVLATPALFLLGASYLAVLTGLNAVVQLRVPDHARARVLSLFTFSLSSFYTLGLVFQGDLAHRLGGGHGVRVVTVVSGVTYLGVVVALMVLRPHWFHALGDRQSAATADT